MAQATCAVEPTRPTEPPVSRVRFRNAYRVINSRNPPIDVFERVADPADWDSLIALEQLTNPRVRDAVGDIARVPPEERVSGPGASWVMAPFCHRSPSRFSAGQFGVYYAAKALITSVRETAFHFGRFLRATAEPAGTMLEMRTLFSEHVDGRFADLRLGYRAEHHPDDYGPAQSLSTQLRAAGLAGLVYRSVRDPGGQCLAIFKPKAIPVPRQGAHLHYHFDGRRIDRYFTVGGDDWQAVWAASSSVDEAG